MSTDAEKAAIAQLEDLVNPIIEAAAAKMPPIVKIERDVRRLGVPAPEVTFIAMVEYLRAVEREHDRETASS